MTFRNRHSLVSGFLCTIFFIAGACALGGCVEITEPQGIGSTDEDERMPLTIRATVSDYIAIGKDGAPTTRIPTENGYTTKFSDGDAIGIFAVRNLGASDAAIIDDINNLKLLYTKAADGSETWTPQSGDTHEFYTYDSSNAITYVAYYPYRDGISITITQSKEQILQSLADNAKLQPAADQSTPAAYTDSDLMTAVATPTADPKDATKKVLALAFEHRRALLVLNPRALINCIPPAGATFEYAGGVLVLDGTAHDATINGVKALWMDDGTFRAIIPVPSTEFEPNGNYWSKDDKAILFTGTPLAAGTLTAGKYYTQQVEAAIYTDGSMTRALQVGDYLCSNGKVMPGETSIITENYIGLVFKVGRFPADDSDYVNGNGEAMNTINGYVVALKDANNGNSAAWGNKTFVLESNRDKNTPYNKFDGFKITQLLKADGINNYPAANACISYTPAADVSTSGWFFPAGGQMVELRNTRNEMKKKSIFTDYNTGRYWQSVQNGSGDSWSVGLTNTGTQQSFKTTGYYVRAILAF